MIAAGIVAACVGDGTGPAGTGGGQTSDDAGVDDAPPTDGAGGAADGAAAVSTFCADRIGAIGEANVLLCADFDEPSAPYGAWKGGVFAPRAFQRLLLRGGTASLQRGSLGTNASGFKLYLDKPPNTGGSDDTGAKYATSLTASEPAKGLRISFDVVVHRSSPGRPLGLLWLRGGNANDLVVRGEDSEGFAVPGNVSLGLFSAGSFLALYGTTPAGALRHVELTLDPDTPNTIAVLSGMLNGAPLRDGDGGMTAAASSAIDTSLELELKSTANNPNDGAAAVEFDNVLIRKLD